MISRLNKTIEFRNPFRKMDHNSVMPIFYCLGTIAVFRWNSDYYIIVMLLVVALFQIFTNIIVKYRHIKYTWRIFVGTTLQTTLHTQSRKFMESHEGENYNQTLECLNWLDETVGKAFYQLNYDKEITFLWKDDAVMFKLSWGGEGGVIATK